MKNWFVYIMTNKRNGTLYVGVTSDLLKRVYEHKSKVLPDSFTAKYDLTKLVYIEPHLTYEDAIPREKQLKKWRRDWKHELIEKTNPHWPDLYEELCQF